MKWNHWLALAALILLVLIGGAMKVCTSQRISKDAFTLRLVEKQREIDSLKAELYWLSHRLPPRYVLPLELVAVSSPVGYRLDPMGGAEEQLHKGVDLVAPIGTPVRAVLAGRVVEHWLVPGWHHGKLYHGDPVFGGKIIIEHEENLFSIYGHLSKTLVQEGMEVQAGQKIGELGDTGISTGPHLHFELVVGPLEYLKEQR